MRSSLNPAARTDRWLRFSGYLRRYLRMVILVISLNLLCIPFALLTPYVGNLLVDKAYAAKDLGLFLLLSLIGGGAFLANTGLAQTAKYLNQRLNRSIYADISRDLFRHLQRLSLSFFNGRSTGEHIYKMSHDTNLVAEFISSNLPQAITVVPRLLLTSAIVFYFDWKLALFALALAPVNCIHPYFFGKWRRELTRKVTDTAQNIFRILDEIFSNIRLVKAFAREKYEISRFNAGLERKVGYELKEASLYNLSDASRKVFSRAIAGIVVLFGGYRVMKGEITLGALTAVLLYLRQMMGMVTSLGDFYEMFVVGSVSAGRLADVLETQPDIKEGGVRLEKAAVKGAIEIKAASFGYIEDRNILDGLTLLIPARSKISLAGRSGCGKTTLLSLMLRLYELKEGEILLDDRDIRGIAAESLREQIGIAMQEPFLWNESVLFNIRYGRENATEAEVMDAARISEAHEFISGLRQGYETVIGEVGCRISEGQKQRIALARMLIKRPAVILLDEAMSSLDSETEDRIMRNINREFAGSTIIAVSHRLSTIKNMEHVYFLKDARTVISGRHEDLIRGCDAYRSLLASQAPESPALNL
ncbi:MAG: ABC transporter ATP-binding protein [Candidatus Omnitrophica bacterium]|nr:ABC transporter ATP-binding protein [Candidatus Omnitrophota bacterium]